jgi:hypothetical protein
MEHHMNRLTFRASVLLALLTIISAIPLTIAGASSRPAALLNADVTGTVTDSASGRPLPNAEVSVTLGNQVIFNASTDAFGRYAAHNLAPGTYTVTARFIGFRPQPKEVAVGETSSDYHLDFSLASIALNLSDVTVTAISPLAIDTRSGDQRFKQDQYHGAPTTTTSQILQQSIAGSARAPTGEVHIRGQHAEYTYYIDGVPVPAGISGSLNELFDPSVVNEIDFKTGGWDAEFGNKNTAVVDISTRIPTGGFHVQAATYAGSFGTNGQSLSASTNSGHFGLFVSGARQETDMRREPVVFDVANHAAVNFHNHGQDLFGFAKLQYTQSLNDVVNLEVNMSGTSFQVPFDSSGGVNLDDRQRDTNGFLNLGWRHQFAIRDSTATSERVGRETEASELFVGAFFRNGTLRYTPGSSDDPQFVFFPDTLVSYNLKEDRSFKTYGVKADYSLHPARELEVKFGTLSQITRGHEDFVTTARDGTFGPASNSNLQGWDVGGYGQVAYSPSEMFEVRTGVRYDAHNAPFAGTRSQVSPRIRLNVFAGPATTLYAYYGRLFLPTNVEDLRAITSVAQQGVATSPTLPERDNFYEAGLLHRFPFGLVSKLAGYYKQSTPGIDDNTVPGSAIVTSVNIDRAYITGVETVQEIKPGGPISGYINLALNHAYGRGPITGGFFPTDAPAGNFDLDHDQRLSGIVSATYAHRNFFSSLTGTYGSGLTNGVDPADCNCSYGTGLLDFNSGIKVPPSFVLQGSAGYSVAVGRSVVRPEVFVDNIFDRKYLLKGAFFSGASVGRPRSVQARLNVAF